ncbi:hypothetical protein EVAR_27233_1 [Eumeta japonica]|uniref:Uncharacterized protein n=1 Tax=Eumeta variegata TaxID=151549 RepID=A0A4C1VWD9_EUMVA|nr:hypothetical protein EVAR_27233_1 [Eumeta japonica]
MSLDRLGLLVGEWSHLLFYVAVNKCPTKLKTRFEQKYSSGARVLPNFYQLVEFLEEEHLFLDNNPRDMREPSCNADHPTNGRASAVGELKPFHHCDGNRTRNFFQFMRQTGIKVGAYSVRRPVMFLFVHYNKWKIY